MNIISSGKSIFGALALSVAPLPLVLTLPATPVSAQETDAAYQDLYDTLVLGANTDADLDTMMEVVRREYASIPEFAAADKASPGFLDELIKEMRPIMRDYQDRVREQYRPQMIAVFVENLTPSEAQDIAAFFRSDVGQRLSQNVSRNYSPDATLDSVGDLTLGTEEEIAQDIQTDISNASSAVLAQTSQEDLEEVGRMAMETPALFKMQTVSQQLLPVRTRMEMEQPTAEEMARIDKMIASILDRRFPE